ncbi:MAG: efflux RND transporter periplasmic adaptor subunit [Phycisphaerae bacterium]
MSAAPDSTSAVLTPYAVNRPRHGARRVGVSVAVVALGALAILLMGGGWSGWTKWFGGGATDTTYYEVKPVDMSITLTEDGELKPVESVEIKSEVEGQATLLFLAEESKRIQKGELLVELASDELVERLEQEEIELGTTKAAAEGAQQELEIVRNENQSALTKAQIALDIADLDLEQYRLGDFVKAQKGADIDIQQTEMDINRKRDDLEKNEKLAVKGFVTKSKLDELRSELEKLELTLEKNNLSKDILNQYEWPKMLKQKMSAVDQARQELDREEKRAESKERQAEAAAQEKRAQLALRESRVTRLRKQVERCKIMSPTDGIVQYPNDNMGWRGGGSDRLVQGSKVFEGQTLLVIPNTDKMLVTARIHEADRHKVTEGLPCIVRVPAAPNQTFNGTISKIARFADSQHRWFNPELKEHATEIMLDEAHAKLSPGDTAEVKILIEEVQNVLAVPVQAVFARGRKNYLFVQRGGGAEPIEVKLGRSSTNLVEITSGVAAGDRVRLSADDKLLAMLPALKQNEDMAQAPDGAGGTRPPGGGGGGQGRPRGGGGGGGRSGGGRG